LTVVNCLTGNRPPQQGPLVVWYIDPHAGLTLGALAIDSSEADYVGTPVALAGTLSAQQSSVRTDAVGKKQLVHRL
jgi:hypothetical protein